MASTAFVPVVAPLRAPATSRAAVVSMRLGGPRRSSRRIPGSSSHGRGTGGWWGGASSGGNDGKIRGNGGAGGGAGGPRGMSEGDAASGGEGAGGLLGVLAAMWAGYNAALESNPILTKAMTSLVGFCLGDILAQKLLGETDEFDKARLARMAAFGFVVHGPIGHFFYGALDRLLPGTQAWKVVSKVAIDQLAWAPVFTVIFFSFLGALEGKSVDDITKKVKNDTWTGVTGSWKVWPMVHTINFRFIPPSQRLLYINTIQVAYNVFLSFIGNKDKESSSKA